MSMKWFMADDEKYIYSSVSTTLFVGSTGKSPDAQQFWAEVSRNELWRNLWNGLHQRSGGFLRARAQILYTFRRNYFACPWKLLKTLQQLVLIILQYDYYYISNKFPLEECDKEEKVRRTGAATDYCLKKEDFKTFCSMPHIRQVTARSAPL